MKCLVGNPKSAFRHLWAAIQLLQNTESRLSSTEIANLTPVYDTMLRLDFLAQKFVPYSSSSFLRCNSAFSESPFWNRASLAFPGPGSPPNQSDQIATEKYRLIQLICAHNKLSRVIWGCWCPLNERPNRSELLGFCSEMQLWKANSPATFTSCEDLEDMYASQASSVSELENLPIPPRPLYFTSTDAALNVLMYDSYLGCAQAMVSSIDTDTEGRELETYNLAYTNLRIAAGLLEKHRNFRDAGSPYKPCDAIGIGIGMVLYHGGRRCFSRAWRQWTVKALKKVGKEGLCEGSTLGAAVVVMGRVEEGVLRGKWNQNENQNQGAFDLAVDEKKCIGPLRDRLMPLLMPPGGNNQTLAFYLRFGNEEVDGDERAVQVVAKATWSNACNASQARLVGRMDEIGEMPELEDLNLEVYEYQDMAERPCATELFYEWRQKVESGWHGYLDLAADGGF